MALDGSSSTFVRFRFLISLVPVPLLTGSRYTLETSPFVVKSPFPVGDVPTKEEFDKARLLDTPAPAPPKRKASAPPKRKAPPTKSESEDDEDSAVDSDASSIGYAMPFLLFLFAHRCLCSSLPELKKKASSPPKKKVKTDDEKKTVIKVEKRKVHPSFLFLFD